MTYAKYRALALSIVVLFSLNIVGAQAAVITQTINFNFTGFSTVTGSPVLHDPVTGQVVLTYDDASPVSVIGQAVDSISFSTPVGVFDTSNVFFDLRIPPDLQFSSQTPGLYEYDVYHDALSVSVNQSDDFLLRIGAFGSRGDEWSVGGITTANAQFLYANGADFSVFSTNATVSTGDLSSTTESAPTSIAAPASLAFLGFGMLAIGLKRRRANL